MPLLVAGSTHDRLWKFPVGTHDTTVLAVLEDSWLQLLVVVNVIDLMTLTLGALRPIVGMTHEAIVNAGCKTNS